MMIDKPTMPVDAIEMEEFLFSGTIVQVAQNCKHEEIDVQDWGKLKTYTRESFRFHRFAVMNWLLMNGVSIPAELLSDQMHMEVGAQMPDTRQL